jgi:hypothetical protein
MAYFFPNQVTDSDNVGAVQLIAANSVARGRSVPSKLIAIPRG